MNELLRIATAELARFLSQELPALSPDWWHRYVLDRLSFQQQRIAEERGHSTLQQLDLAALLRVLDSNWSELAQKRQFPREGRSWLKELQTVRNKWAHLSTEALPGSELYRDVDTLGRVLAMLKSDPGALQAVDAAKSAALAEMLSEKTPSPGDRPSDTTLRPTPREERGGKATQAGSEVTSPTFKPGDLVALRSNPSEIMPIIDVIGGSGECRYRVFQNNTRATYYESQLQPAIADSGASEAIDVRQLHAHLTSLQILSPSTMTLYSLRSGRVQFVPYQYRPVLKLLRSDRPRLLIADEVGVGKTIEAGLIIKELRARSDITSVLVICPKPLVAERKWFSEMKRFDEYFTALDGPMLRHCIQEAHLEGEWPEQYAKAILPFSLLDSDLLFGKGGRGKKSQGLIALDPPPKFDLVIVDEAHHIRNSDTYLHQAVRYFCDNAQAVVLLTATPVQLGSSDLFTLLNVLRPDLIIDEPSFAQMAEPNAHINASVHHCRAADRDWQAHAHAELTKASQTQWGRLFLRESPAFQSVFDRVQSVNLADADRVALIRNIEELYTFSPLINRTRRRDIGDFTIRKPETVTIEFTPDQKRLHDELLDVVARILSRCHGQTNVKFMMTTLRRQAASCLYGLAPLLSDILLGKLDRLELMEASDTDAEPELGFLDQIRSEIEELLEQSRTLPPDDPKIDAFIKIVLDKSKLPKNKALVFSTFRHTLAYLNQHAKESGLRVGLIHGDIADDERSDLRRRFALPECESDALDVLLSSEVGCEGLDFQFCDFLINYDLPWNPMRIEQRIGRIDRYGQSSETVGIINLITPGTVDADIYERCLWRIGVFQHAVGGSEEILGAITQQLHDIAESFNLSAADRQRKLQQLADNGIRQLREEQELESKQAELFGLNVPSRSWRDEIQEADTFWLSPASIEHAVRSYVTARAGGDAEHILGEKPLKTLRLSHEARRALLEDYKSLPRSIEPVAREWERWLKGNSPTTSITFDQKAAADNRESVHISVVHPLVRQAARFLEITEPKFCSLVIPTAELTPGTHQFALYRWTKLGIQPDELLVPISNAPGVERLLLSLLPSATDGGTRPRPSRSDCDVLDARHHSKWTEARAQHIADNAQRLEHRMHSLKVSHGARTKAIDDQLARATNERIRLMKEGELARANADFDRRIAELRDSANRADIKAAPVIFGTITVTQAQS